MITGDKWRQRITCDSELHHGEPCVTGTRIAVAVLVASLAEMAMADLLKEYPQLNREDIQAAILYAAEAAHSTLVV